MQICQPELALQKPCKGGWNEPTPQSWSFEYASHHHTQSTSKVSIFKKVVCHKNLRKKISYSTYEIHIMYVTFYNILK